MQVCNTKASDVRLSVVYSEPLRPGDGFCCTIPSDRCRGSEAGQLDRCRRARVFESDAVSTQFEPLVDLREVEPPRFALEPAQRPSALELRGLLTAALGGELDAHLERQEDVGRGAMGSRRRRPAHSRVEKRTAATVVSHVMSQRATGWDAEGLPGSVPRSRPYEALGRPSSGPSSTGGPTCR
jgi:hypothetical protein